MKQHSNALFGTTLLFVVVSGLLGSSSSAIPSNPVVIMEPIAGSNTLNIAISAKGSVRYDLGFPIGSVNIPINSSDSETAQIGGTQTLALEAIFNEEHQGTVTGVNFTDGNIQVLNTLNWQLGLGSYLGFAIGNVYVTGSNLSGQLFTPNPMSLVSEGTTFPLADHELILDGGNLTGYATGRASGSIDPFDIDLAVSPISGVVASSGTGSVTLSSPTVLGNTISYTVTATVPMNFSYLLMTDPVNVTVAITGTTQWQGTLTRSLPSAAPTQTALSALSNPSIPGTSVTFTATVQESGVTAASATGNMIFQIDGSDVATITIANGSASYSTSDLSMGVHTLTAVYSGDADYLTSTSNLIQGVYPPPITTETDLAFTNGSFAPLAANNLILGNAGDSSALNYFEASGGWTPSHLTDGDIKAPGSVGNGTGVYSIMTGGSVTYPLGDGTNGTGYTITGIRALTSWNGGGRVNPNFSASYSLDGVNFIPLATVNFSAPTVPAASQSADVTLGVSGLKNVRSIRFTFPNTQQNDGVSYTELAVFGKSSGLTYFTPTQTALSASANPSAPGTSVTFTATVLESGVTAVDATGHIVFLIDGADVGTLAIANGLAIYTTDRLTDGTHAITATYSGDADFATSITNLTQDIYQPPSVTETDLTFTSGSFAPLAANNLILGNPGDSSALNFFEAGEGWTPACLTDGDIKAPGLVGNGTGVYSIITSGSVTYPLGGGTNGTGYTLTGIRALTSWNGGGRVNPYFTASFSQDGVNFYPIATVNFNAPAGSQGADVALGVSGLTHVKSIRFTFPSPQQNDGVSYTELAVLGKSSGLIDLTPTQTALSASVNPSSPGTSVTFTATVQVNGIAATNATGNIVFLIDGEHVATLAIANGSASYTTNSLTAGTHTLTAVYSGDADYDTSANCLSQTIYQTPTVTQAHLSLTSGSFATQGANNLILGNAGTSTLTTVTYAGTATNLTDGVLQAPGSPGTSASVVMIKTGTVTYNLGNGSEGLGYTLTGIRSLTAWTDSTRINPKYSVSYSFDGITFVPLATVNYSATTGAKGTDVALAVSGATRVKYLQFTFPNTQQNSGVAYSELAAYGTSTTGAPLSLSSQILPPERTRMVLNFNGLVIGHSYTVQSSPSLSANSWSDEVTFTATQSTAAFTYAMGENTQCFYRLQY